MVQHEFLLEQIKAISVNQICSTDGRQVVSLHVKAKWMETMTCSAQPLGILPDWFGRQLIGITPELFDEADKKQCKTLQLTIHHLALQTLGLLANTESDPPAEYWQSH